MPAVHLSNLYSNVIVTGGRLIFDNPDKECSNISLQGASGIYVMSAYHYGGFSTPRGAAYPYNFMFSQVTVTAPKTGVMIASIGVRCRIVGGGSGYDYANATPNMWVNGVFASEGGQYNRIGRNSFTESVSYGTCCANVTQGDTVNFGATTRADIGNAGHTYDDQFEVFWYSASTMTF